MAINFKMDSVTNILDVGNICRPKDYSVSALTNPKSDTLENSNSSNECYKVKLNFGVDRLLSNNNEDHVKPQNYTKNTISTNFNNNQNSVPNSLNSNYNGDLLSSVNSQIGLNLLQFPLSAVANGLYTSNQNFILKPFPLRMGAGGGSQNGNFLCKIK